ncbi:MAG TPA: hypothetical protein DDX54_07080 [Rhodospirillaceae bacterium]|jgi:hypothetical protein|nr:hypothetical protein [Alphaproteobacteria bacterium]HBH27143.1 hypothetical protein [Rhodospirillaceae bacterium]
MTTPVNLATQALIGIGAKPISAFDDGSAEAEIAGALYDGVRDGLLSAYTWSFATGQVAPARLAGTPLADYPYAFALPTDFLRAVSVGSGGRGRGVPYRVARGALHARAESVVLTYIFRPEEAAFPPFFAQALIARLRAELCIPLTENTDRAAAMAALADDAFGRARQVDAQQDTPKRIEDWSLINARVGS